MTTTIEKILARAAELEAQAGALRLAAALLNGEAHTQKRATVHRTLRAAATLRQAQRNGGPPARTPARSSSTSSAPPPETWQQKTARRDQKAAEIVGLVRDYGKPMPLAALVEAARARGIRSLTGMNGYVRAGYMAVSGRKGKTRYTFKQMPAPRVDTRST